MFHGLAFLVGTVAIAILSRGSLASWRNHGFFRFFAFEAILALVLVNVDGWFADPLAARQIVSWLLLLASILLAVHGFSLLHRMGRPDRRIRDSTRLGVEKTTHLVSAGAYRYIRHPLYASLLCFGWGTFLKQPSWLGLALVAITTVALYLTARVEETENLQHFGGEYADYVRQTRMFVPFVF